ncbi:KilA-N domain-containing protein [Arthrospira platensis SPKY2]
MSNTKIVTVDGFDFQYRNDDYVNLTKMCKQINKKLNHYLSNDSTKSFLKALSSEAGIPVTGLTEIRRGGKPQEQGTYGHPLVAIHLAQWLSPEFALAITKLTQSYLHADISIAEDILKRTSTESINSESGLNIIKNIINKANEKTESNIQARLNTKKTNKELNRALSECPKVSKAVYAMAQDSIFKATYGKTIKTLKKEKGLAKKQTIRDDMNTDELVHLSFCESMSTKVLDKSKPSGDRRCAKTVYDTSKKVKQFETLLLNGVI